jgi:hypothetical protein
LLIKRNFVEPQDVSYQSINRLLSNHKLLRAGNEPNIQRKRFAYDTVNTLWQGDMSVGPYLVIGHKKRRTFLFAFIDDCSRLIQTAQKHSIYTQV